MVKNLWVYYVKLGLWRLQFCVMVFDQQRFVILILGLRFSKKVSLFVWYVKDLLVTRLLGLSQNYKYIDKFVKLYGYVCVCVLIAINLVEMPQLVLCQRVIYIVLSLVILDKSCTADVNKIRNFYSLRERECGNDCHDLFSVIYVTQS